jgi:hypothetical protein
MKDEKISMAEQMRQHIAARQLSGVYVDQYCKEQNLKPSAYYYWRKKLSADPKINTGSFIQLQPVSQSGSVEIIFTNGVKIHFDNLVPAAYLKQLVS